MTCVPGTDRHPYRATRPPLSGDLKTHRLYRPKVFREPYGIRTRDIHLDRVALYH